MARLIVVEDNAELASLIASAARGRGHEVTEALLGRAALASLVGGAFDCAVVDLLLPDMRGGEVLAELKQRNIPSLVMSGVYKGDRFAEEARRIYDVKGFFEKPFELKALLDRIDELTGGPVQPESEEGLEEIYPLEDEHSGGDLLLDTLTNAPPTRPAHPLPKIAVPLRAPWEEDEPGEDELTVRRELPSHYMPPPIPSTKRPRPSPLESKVKVHALTPAPKTDEHRIEESFAELNEGVPSPPEPSQRTSDSALPIEQRKRNWDAPAAPRSKTPIAQTSGDLSTTSVPRLLTAYYQAKHRGELRLKQGQAQKIIFFDRGEPIYAGSNLSKDRFSAFCLRQGVLGEFDLASVSSLAKEQNLKSGDAMVQLGLLDEKRKRGLIVEHVKEIIWMTFWWKDGEYAFVSKPVPAPEPISLFPGNLIMEGVAKTETLVSLRQKVGRSRKLFPSVDPPYQLHEIALSGEQAKLLAYADGTKTVEDLLALVDLTEREVLATLHGLELLGLLEERREDGKQRRISFGL
ncbi:MAG: response regulator [Myxococcaceae bacterium]